MFSHKSRKFQEPPPEVVSKYLSSKTVTFLKADDRIGALRELVDLLDSAHQLEDKEAFFQAIMQREKIVTTGIGMGVAIPHAKLPGYDSFFIAIGIHTKGLEWHSIDGMPVRLIFMIGGPDDKQTEYLQLLSHLTLAIKDEDRRKKMLQLVHPKDIIALFKGL
jgi:PTS system nitrogen regulatory IIA component